MKDKNQADSLIICTTPLQMIIAEKIIQVLPNKTFNLLVLAQSHNDKYQYYFDRLKKSCCNSVYYILNKGLLGFISFIRTIKSENIDLNYSNIYLASIDSSYCQYMLSHYLIDNIFTFDDGTANIIPESTYYKPIHYGQLKRIVRKLFGIKYNIETIRKKTKLHYTIYKDLPNIVEPTKLLKLIESTPIRNSLYEVEASNINIYLGQPLDEININLTQHELNKTLQSLNITHYFPHPRETLPTVESSCKVIKSRLVFEDYVAQMLKDNFGVTINVYSFSSTAILNISNIEYVNVSYITHSDIDPRLNGLHSLAQNKFNIPLIDISK